MGTLSTWMGSWRGSIWRDGIFGGLDLHPQKGAHPMCHQGFVRTLVVSPVPPVSLVQSGEDLMRFVDHGEIECRGGAEGFRAGFATGELSAHQIHAWREEGRFVLTCLNAEQVQ